MTYRCNLGFVGAQHQTIEFGIVASATDAIEPILDLPHLLPAMMVSRS